MADELDDDDQEGSDIAIAPNDLRSLRQKAREYDAAQAKLAGFERELAFAKSGLDLNDKRMGYFIKGYEGEMQPEAIRAAAEEAGFFQSPPPPPTEAVPPGEMSSHQQMNSAAAGAEAGAPFDLSAAIASAQSSEEVLAIMTKQGYPTTLNRTDY